MASEGNLGYIKTWPGLLKLFELIIGAVVVGLLGYYYSRFKVFYNGNVVVCVGNPDLFLLLMAVTFLIGTFCLLLACLISDAATKSIYEVIYHFIAFVLLLSASVFMLVYLKHWGRGRQYDAYMAASILALFNAILYFVSTFLACRSYQG